MDDNVGFIIGCLAVLGLLAAIAIGALFAGYGLWMRRRRMEQALEAAAAEAADQQAQRGGGGPTKPVVPK
jgi:uncharacterized iron-regulated membrane protein